MNQVQTLRSSVAGTRPTGRPPGELFTNWPDKQIGVIDAANQPLDLVAVRYFSVDANYPIGEFVVEAGQLWRSVVAVVPAPFDPTQWMSVEGAVAAAGGSVTMGDVAPPTPQPGDLWFDSVGGQLYVWYDDASSQQWVIAVNATQDLTGYAQLSGAAFTGPLTGTTSTFSGTATFNGNPGISVPLTAKMGLGAYLNAADATLTVDNNAGEAAQFLNETSAAGAVSVVVYNNRTDGVAIQFRFGGTAVGSITQNGAATAYNTSSDYRLKTTHGDAGPLVGAMIDAVPVYDAEWTNAPKASGYVEHARRYPMFLAHELQAQCPWAVNGEKDATNEDGSIAPQQVDHSHLVAVMWAEIQNLRQRLATLEGAR